MLWVLGLYSLVFVASIAAFVGVVIALPAKYFAKTQTVRNPGHPIVLLLGVIAKNLLGLAIVALGLLLSLPGIPGQGLLTIVIGAMLLDFPGKHHLVMAVVRRRGILDNLNRLRRALRRPPLQFPAEVGGPGDRCGTQSRPVIMFGPYPDELNIQE